MARYVDPTALVGSRFGRLVVIRFNHTDSKNSHWLCLCDCGNTKVVCRSGLIQGQSKSCGCFRDALRIKHGQVKSPEYISWGSMIQRCTNPKSANFSDYGGRGIKVCKRWMIAKNFLDDMGKKPSRKHSLERKDNSKGYNRRNCVWAVRKVQNRNTRRTILLTACGKTQCLKDWSKELKLSSQCIMHRIRNMGLSHQQALNPVKLFKGRPRSK